jgi:hypothetical protein
MNYSDITLKGGFMKKTTLFIVMVMVLSSCLALASSKTIGQIKEGLSCVEYKEAIPWADVKAKLGQYDIAPIPEPGPDVLKNARVYQNVTVIFYTDVCDVKIGDKVRPQEVVYKVEICKEQ